MSEGEETIWLQDFKFDTVNVPCPTILLVGKRFSGKSYTSVSIADKFPVDRWCAWCGTKDTRDFWADKFGSSATVRGPDEAGLKYLIDVKRDQERRVSEYKNIRREPFPANLRVGMIFDDCTAERVFRKGQELEDLFANGRHYETVIIISCQYLKQLPPPVRSNADYIFMMHNTKATCKMLHESYVENPDSFEGFLDLIRSVTGQKDENGNELYNGLVYDNVVKTSKLDEMFKVYRSEGKEIISQMRIGSHEWREYNREHYKDATHETQLKEYRKRNRMLRIQELRKNRIARLSNSYYQASTTSDQGLDYISDSGSEGDLDTNQQHDTVQLGGRRGVPRTTVSFGKKARPPKEGRFDSIAPPQQTSDFPPYQIQTQPRYNPIPIFDNYPTDPSTIIQNQTRYVPRMI